MEVRPLDWSPDNWATPWPIVQELEERYGPFDLDPGAEQHTAKAPRFYTREDDGLSHPWFGRVFVNPPYSDPRPWCERAVRAVESEEAELVVMLLPASTDTGWFHEFVLPNADIEFLRGRIRFLGWAGAPIGSPRTGSLIAVLPAGAAARWAEEKCA
jgi:phage N-6-adenine-methyltransferase